MALHEVLSRTAFFQTHQLQWTLDSVTLFRIALLLPWIVSIKSLCNRKGHNSGCNCYLFWWRVNSSLYFPEEEKKKEPPCSKAVNLWIPVPTYPNSGETFSFYGLILAFWNNWLAIVWNRRLMHCWSDRILMTKWYFFLRNHIIFRRTC